MRNYKFLLFGTLSLFLLINTRYYWEGILGPGVILFGLVLLALFITLLAGFVSQLYYTIKERFSNRKRTYLTIIMAFALTMVIAMPGGIINERFESKDVFVAESEGPANCTTTFSLKENNEFYVKDICFGIYRSHGNYAVKNDTIKFHYLSADHINPYGFGIYKPDTGLHKKSSGELYLYKSKKDTLPYPMEVYENNLFK